MTSSPLLAFSSCVSQFGLLHFNFSLNRRLRGYRINVFKFGIHDLRATNNDDDTLF